MPSASGSPTWIGAPWTRGNRAVTAAHRGDAVGRERPHGDHQRTRRIVRPTRPRRLLRNSGPWMPSSTWRRRTPAAAQRVLHREPAADRDGDRVVTPEVGDVVARLGRLTAAMDEIAGEVGAHVDVLAERPAGASHRPRSTASTGHAACVGAAERDELLRDIRRDDSSQIALHVARRLTGRQAAVAVRRGSRAAGPRRVHSERMIAAVAAQHRAGDVARRDARRERGERAELLDGAVAADRDGRRRAALAPPRW